MVSIRALVVALAPFAWAGLHRARAAEDPLAYKAWSFVRGISSELGSQAQGVLEVQNNLEAVELNVTAEAKRWENKKAALVTERTSMEAELARLAADQRTVQQLQTQAQALRTQTADAAQETSSVVAQTCAEEDARKKEAAQHTVTVAQLQGKLSAAQTAAGTASTAQFTALRSVRQAVQDLENEVYTNVQLLRQLQQQAVQNAALRAQGQADILKQNIVTQQQNAHLESQLLSSTTEAGHVQRLEHQEATLAQQTKEMGSRVVAETSACEQEVHSLETQVRAIQAEYAQQANGIRQCQAADAEGQRLTAKLASCPP